MERIERAPVHRARQPMAPDPPDQPPRSPDLPDITDVSGAPFGQSFRARLRDKLEDLGELWSQTTFYLFDRDSWRWPDVRAP